MNVLLDSFSLKQCWTWCWNGNIEYNISHVGVISSSPPPQCFITTLYAETKGFAAALKEQEIKQHLMKIIESTALELVVYCPNISPGGWSF